MKKIRIKKAKNAFVYDKDSNKYYDLRCNSNILGYGHKLLTSYTKNMLSSSWNIKMNTRHHDRMTGLYKRVFGEGRHIRTSNSLEEFFCRLFLSAAGKYRVIVTGKRFEKWLGMKNIKPIDGEAEKNIKIIDANEIFLSCNGDNERFKYEIRSMTENNDDTVILNYYWYPYPGIETGFADVVILPEIYCGNFGYISILVKDENDLFDEITGRLSEIDSLFISVSLKNYYLIMDALKKNNDMKLEWKGFISAGRLLVPENEDDIDMLSEKLFEDKIIINDKPPYYNYMPINLEDYQKKRLRKAGI